jgi:arginyl-tRNA synthetase
MLDIYTKFKNAYINIGFDEIIKFASIEFDSDEYICEPVEILLAVYILQFPPILELVESKLNPHILIEYIYQLSQVANNFYNNPLCICLNIDKDLDNFTTVTTYNRIVLVICYLKLMNTLAQILGISFLETM